MEQQTRGYRDLLVWQQGMRLAKGCYLMTRAFPRDELYGLTTQIRRAAATVPANIAEGSARGTSKDFASFLRTAQGSLRELETDLLLSVEIDGVTQQQAEPLLTQAESVSKLLNRLLRSQT